MDIEYSKRELDHMFNDIKLQLDRIEHQTTKHNGRLSKVEKILLILGTATIVLLVVSGSKFVDFLMAIT